MLGISESQRVDDLSSLAAVVQQGAGSAAGRGPAGAENPQNENADPNVGPVADPMDEFVEIIEMVEQASAGNSKGSPQANEPRYQQRPLLVHGQSFEDRTDNSSKVSSAMPSRPPKESPGGSKIKHMVDNEAARTANGSINVVYNRGM